MPKDQESIPYVQRVQTKTGTKLYFRKGSVRRPLLNADGSEELRAEVEGILAKLAKTSISSAPRAGTVGGAFGEYYRSADFLTLEPSTQSEYKRLIDELIADVGDVRLGEVDAGWVDALRDAWAPRGYRAANLRLQMLINALKKAIRDGRINKDPFAGLKKVRRPHSKPEPNPVWTDAEVDAVIDLALARNMPGLARAIGLGRWGGFRRGSICLIPTAARLQDMDEDRAPQSRLLWRTRKGNVLCDKLEDARLTSLINATPNRAETIAFNKRGQPWKERQLNQATDRLIASLAADGRARSVLTLHGLRHSRGVELALAGASDAEIMSQLEHADSRTAQIYRRQAKRRTLADQAQKKIDDRRSKRATVEGPESS